jgi:hypothetical protein
MSRNECFSRFEYHTFYVLYLFVTYLLSLPGMWRYNPEDHILQSCNLMIYATLLLEMSK